MKAMFETIADDFTGEVDHHSVVVVDESESALLDRIDALRDRFDVGVGSYPGEYVEVRIRGTDEPEVERAADWLREQVDLVEE
jgi:molybdopterin-biosynthesis enzyme MoeA-like protein